MKLKSWPEIGPDGDVLLMSYVPKGDCRVNINAYLLEVIIEVAGYF